MKQKLPVKYAWLYVIVVTIVAMYPSLNNGWVNWDDQAYALENSLLNDLSVKGIIDIFSTFQVVGNYHPFTLISLAIDNHIGEADAFIYHLHSLLLHLANTYLVFVFISSLSNRFELALFVALMFGVHPMHVESVAWISARKDVLYTFYLLLSLIAYLKYSSLKSDYKYYVFSLVLFVFSILSKGMAFTLPVYLLLIDYLKERRINMVVLKEKVPYVLISVVFICLSYFAQNKAGAIDFIDHLSLFDRIVVALYSLSIYSIKAVFPYDLAAFHPYPISWGKGLPTYMYSFLILIPFLIWWGYRIRSDKYVIFGVLFFMGSLFPVLQIIPFGRAIMADRYSYIAYIGFFVVFGHLLLGFSKYKALSDFFKLQLFVLLSVVFGLISFNQTKTWKNGETLWSRVLKVYPEHYFAYANRGDYYLRNNNKTLALEDFNKSIQLYPYYPKSFHDRGKLHFEIGYIEEAINDYTSAINLDSTYSRAYLNRAQARGSLNQFDLALIDLDSAIHNNPFYSLAYLNRAVVYQKANQLERALNDFNKAIELEHNNALYYRYRAVLKIEMANSSGAIMDLKKAISINPKDRLSVELLTKSKRE